MLTYFYEKDELGLDVLIPRPQTKHASDLERIIALGKPQRVIDLFAEMVSAGEQWDWFDRYNEYLEDLEAWKLEIANHVPELDEEGNEVEWIKPTEPTEPPRPAVRAAEGVLLPYYASRRSVLYPSLGDFADAFVKSQGGDNTEMEAYVKKCLDIKSKIPKATVIL